MSQLMELKVKVVHKGKLLKETECMIYDSSFYHFITVACQLCEATQKPSYVREILS
jgi:hypothetical protein